MKTVLIPTDFSITSLNMVKQAASYFLNERIKVVLFHALYMPTDIQDLLSLNGRAPHEKITEDFRHACATIKKKNNDVIAHISFQHIYGNTSPVFRNFTDANAIDYIFMPAHIQLQQAYPNSVDMRSLFKYAAVPYITNTTPVASKRSEAAAFTKNLVLAEG